MAFYNSQGQQLVLVSVTVPFVPSTLSPEEQTELINKYVEFGQLWHLVKRQSPIKDDLAQVNLFWNQYGVPSTRNRRNWESLQAPKDHLSRLKKRIRELGGDPDQVRTGQPLAAVNPPGQPVGFVPNVEVPAVPVPGTQAPRLSNPATNQPLPTPALQQTQASNPVNEGWNPPDDPWAPFIDPRLM